MRVAVLFFFGIIFCNRLEHLYPESDAFYWENHVKVYGLNLRSQRGRFTIFKKNLDFIRIHNSNPEKSFYLKLNKFAHLSDEEFNSIYKRCYLQRPKGENNYTYLNRTVSKLAPRVDWRVKGKVTPVKDQMNCGSCWAFGVTGAIESQYLLTFNKTILLSEQQLVDCTTSINVGCNGGYPYDTFRYLTSTPIVKESEYPYKGYDKKCIHKTDGLTIRGVYKVGEEDYVMMDVLFNNGPVSIAIDASHRSFRFYGGGVYYEENCSPHLLDHAVLVVGYNIATHNPYYIVKNSWASDWGENGYINVFQGRNHCGVVSEAYIPQL